MKFEEIVALYNSRPIDDFLGLSPNQVSTIIYGPLESMQEVVSLNESFNVSLLEDVKVISEIKALISLIGEAGEAKATQNGYLPKKIVNALYKFKSLPGYTVQSEEAAPNVSALRHAATACGWMKKRAGKFSLTKDGRRILDHGFSASHYVSLLSYWLRRFNWSFLDRYSECPSVQQGAVFGLYILHKQANELVPVNHLAKLFMTAFPHATEEIEAETLFFETTREEELRKVFSLRFIKRFAAYFGLISCIPETSSSYVGLPDTTQVKTTPLFSEVLVWFPPDH